MSLMSLLAASHLLPEEKRKKAEHNIADLEKELQGIQADQRAIELDPITFYRARFGSGMERADELCLLEKAKLDDLVAEGQRRMPIIERQIELLRERI